MHSLYLSLYASLLGLLTTKIASPKNFFVKTIDKRIVSVLGAYLST